MGLSSVELKEVLELVDELFTCLRCGECCLRWRVQFDDGKVKERMKKCNFLESSRLEGERWHEASCKIYSSRPKQCREFKFAFSAVCPIGLWRWTKLINQFPNSQLPERVSLIIRLLNGKNNERRVNAKDEEFGQ